MIFTLSDTTINIFGVATMHVVLLVENARAAVVTECILSTTAISEAASSFLVYGLDVGWAGIH